MNVCDAFMNARRQRSFDFQHVFCKLQLINILYNGVHKDKVLRALFFLACVPQYAA